METNIQTYIYIYICIKLKNHSMTLGPLLSLSILGHYAQPRVAPPKRGAATFQRSFSRSALEVVSPSCPEDPAERVRSGAARI